MSKRAEGDVVLVVGGTGGLGREICVRLAPDWRNLAVSYYSNADGAKELTAALSGTTAAWSVRLDVTDPASIREVLDSFGAARPLGCVVFASGADIMQPLLSRITHAEWARSIETELLGFANLMTELIPIFRRQGGGKVIALTSFANTRYAIGDALSAVPKAGIEQFVRALAAEQGRFGIRANCVAPGLIEAGLGKKFKNGYWSEEIWNEIVGKIPLGRAGEGIDIAEAVAFLASERASYITGQTLVVDGGLHL